MKLIPYSILVGLIAGLLVCALYAKMLAGLDHVGASLVLPLLICEVVCIGLVVGVAVVLSKRTYFKAFVVRPLIYWPTIGLLAALLTKSSDALSLGLWLAIGLAVGAAVDWRSRKSRAKSGAKKS